MLQKNFYGNSIMPLLLEFTPKTQIQEGRVDERLIYDSMRQITKYSMLTGTKCLRSKATKCGPALVKSDYKNEIDDAK